jgi:hypothetical protein
VSTMFVPAELPNGVTVRIEARSVGEVQKVGALLPVQFAEITGAIEGISQALIETLDRVRPQKVSVEFGLELGFEAGKLTALLVKGTATANLSIKLEWAKDGKPSVSTG